VKITQEKRGITLDHTVIGNNFMNGTPITQQLKESIDKWDCMKLKSFCPAKGQSTEWEKIFASYTYDKGLITRIYRELKKLNSQRITNPLNKWATEQIILKRSPNGQ
jgi:hypothetical protein